MFDSMKQSEGISGAVYFTSLLVSLIAHAVVICVLVIVPLVFFNVLQSQELLTFLIEPPPPPVQPPPPSPPAQSAAAQRSVAATTEYLVPRKIPVGIPPATDAEVLQPMPTWTIPGSVIPGSRGGEIGRSISSLLEDDPPRIKTPRPPTPGPAPIRVGTLEASKLVYKVNPVYPPLAVKAHVSGNVILEAVVDEEGNVSAIKVLSGHTFLVDAAVQAVKQWKYSPTVLNGEPVPVIATVTVIFRLN
jgi:protein TonB